VAREGVESAVLGREAAMKESQRQSFSNPTPNAAGHRFDH
jgi:hypothetical protein